MRKRKRGSEGFVSSGSGLLRLDPLNPCFKRRDIGIRTKDLYEYAMYLYIYIYILME